MSVESLFLHFSVDKLRQFIDRIDICLSTLTDEQIWARGGENENAIGNLVLHLTGNVRQWIVTSLGNNPDKRDRDSEFDARGGVTKTDLAAGLRETVEAAAHIIEGLDPDRLTRIYEIQKYRISGVEVVYHVVEHFAQHTGQIIFVTKMLAGNDLGFYRHLRNAEATEQTP